VTEGTDPLTGQACEKLGAQDNELDSSRLSRLVHADITVLRESLVELREVSKGSPYSLIANLMLQRMQRLESRSQNLFKTLNK